MKVIIFEHLTRLKYVQWRLTESYVYSINKGAGTGELSFHWALIHTVQIHIFQCLRYPNISAVSTVLWVFEALKNTDFQWGEIPFFSKKKLPSPIPF